MRFKTLVCIALVILFLILIPKARARQEKPKPVEQGVKVVADVSPSHLEDEIKKLNKEGYAVYKNNLLIVGDKITILVDDNDADQGDEEEEKESGR